MPPQDPRVAVSTHGAEQLPGLPRHYQGGRWSHDPRLARVRWIAWLLDRSIPIGKYRIGIDPLLGLFPGVGDALAGFFSFMILFEGARLGLPARALVSMVGNVLIETLVGAIPVVGDVFDFAWQANVRNMRIIDQHYDPARADRPVFRRVVALAAAMLVILAVVLALAIYLAVTLWTWAWNALA